MSNKNNGPLRRLRIKKSDNLKTIYAKARRAFTAVDLQRFADTDETVPAEEVLAKVEAIARSKRK